MQLRQVPGWLLVFDNADAGGGHPGVAAGRCRYLRGSPGM